MTDGLTATASTVIEAPATDVWQALTDPKLIKQYMAGADVVTDWQVGSPITWKGEWNGKPFEDRGEILELVPQKRLKTTHSTGASDDVHVVTYDLTDSGSSTKLTVTQENTASPEMVAESEKTWAMMLNGIKGIVES